MNPSVFYIVALVVLGGCSLFFAAFSVWLVHQLKQAMHLMGTTSSDALPIPAPVQSTVATDEDLLNQATVDQLTHKVCDLQRKLGGMAMGLHKVNHQVQQLSAQHHVAGTMVPVQVQQHTNEDGATHIVIEVRPVDTTAMAADQAGQAGYRSPFDIDESQLPEDLREKFRAFHAVHKAVIKQRRLPSQEAPELN
ncbi:MAG: hypothetical protein KC476_09325 [Cyanobacteria bacterium HKST-UBA06]|nr:hypothetical protein [Cyanobacteria bacterium HKST-UBA04]MCA9808141.1 hypothetical protein [Cyanobacteria bacterium HKST-UBA06]MCA9842288.1 hypothetical protein [Cyanobacteria bacterium HKST-UBA03]